MGGCELNATTRTFVVEVEDDLLEHLLYLKTVSLGEDADAKLHVIAMESKNMTTSLKPMPFVSLKPSVLPMISLGTFALVPPVAFTLKSGTGPVYLHGEHVILSDYEPSEDELPPDEGEDDTGQENTEEDEEANAEPGTDDEEPGADDAEPGTDYTEPGVDSEEPGVDSEEPGVDDAEMEEVKYPCLHMGVIIGHQVRHKIF
nr:nucleoplasmin-like [Anolis sagrei ordinatus]